MTDQPAAIRVALLGGGTVGSQVARIMLTNSGDLASRVGVPLELVGVAVRDAARPRIGIPPELITDDPAALVARDDVDVVVEVMGGTSPAKELILAAFDSGAAVVSANKELIAKSGPELHAAAEASGVDFYYEAAVAGAIPLLRPLKESLSGDKVRRVLGIVNGTTNYILTKMDEDGADYEEALADAQRLGYAEADPTADVGGADAAAKAAILAVLAFHTSVGLSDVYCEGITSITAEDIAAARDMGFVIKLLAVAELTPDERGVVVRVHPAMVPREHPLAAVRDAFNAVFVEADAAGQMMFYGRGAGGEPTASAVLGDLVSAARHRVVGARGPAHSVYADVEVRPVSDATTRYAVNLRVADRPGVLQAIAGVFAENNVSIQTVRQEALDSSEAGHEGAHLLVRTHVARESDLQATVAALSSLESVQQVVGVVRVEGEASP